MKSFMARLFAVMICSGLLIFHASAGPYHTRVITSSSVPLTLSIAQNVFLRIRNFTQEGGSVRGTVAVTVDNQTVNILSATQINATTAVAPEVMNRVVIAGPATVTVNPVAGATLTITYQKEREGAPLATPAPTATATATPTATPTPTP